MRLLVRFGLTAALTLALLALAAVQAQDAKTAAPRVGLNPAAAQNDVVLATVNGREIKRSEILKIMSQIDLGAEASIEDQYQMAANMLVNTELLVDFLSKNKFTVSRKELDDERAKYEESVKKEQKKTLEQALREVNSSVSEFEQQVSRAKMWEKYCTKSFSDDKLKSYANANKEYFQGAKVRARHILLKVEPVATPDQQKKVIDRLLAIRKEITDGQLDFADAANKYSEDDGNVQVKAGGDLGTFRRKGDMVEEFAAAAFSLKPGVVSAPVHTMFGYHLILVSERDEGKPIDFEKLKPFIFQAMEMEERERIIIEARKIAKIDIKPMPADIKPATPPPAPPPPAAAKPAAGKGQ